jgi:hypothetical protein
VRAFRFEHRFGTEAKAVQRLVDLGIRAVGQGLLPAHPTQWGQPPVPARDGALS